MENLRKLASIRVISDILPIEGAETKIPYIYRYGKKKK